MIRLMTLASPLVLAVDLMVAAAPSSLALDTDTDTETITIQVSDSTVVLGTKVTVRGRAPSLRHVILQMATAENGWQAFAETVTGLSGDYAFTAPGWYGVHRLRVLAPSLVVVNPAVSEVRTVTVKMGYRPVGDRSDWAWLGRSGPRWQPCRKITYRINPAGGYDGAVSDIRTAVRSAARITGLQLTYLGTTTSAVTRDRRGYHPLDTDIVLDWQTPKQDGGLSGTVAGIGGHWVQENRRFDGYVVLDRTARLARRTWRQIIEHEMGHVLGLAHAHAASQLMYGSASEKNPRWGAGDLTGLRRIGASQGCLSQDLSLRPSTPERVDSAGSQ